MKNCFLLLVSVLIFTACKKESTREAPIPPGHEPTESQIIRIPVVVHVLYADEQQNISTEKIISQIKVLNEDFRMKNADRLNTPAEFASLVTDAGIEFFLATKDPQGINTSGITRTQTQVTGWEGRVGDNNVFETMSLYISAKGGQDAWPTDRYLNIWVADLSDRLGRLGIAGYAQFPGGDPRTDGVVIDPRVFGTVAPLSPGHELGRTATHEIGHWLNLKHIFAAETCGSSDEVDDTPPTERRYQGNPSYPQFSCGNSNMFMNFMDNVDDDAMFMFTHGQRKRMRALFAEGGARKTFVR
jgi:hypothetical protein